MPSTITHANMANDIYNKLNKKLKNKFQDKLDLYITYSQGPDVLFFYPMIPNFSKYKKINNLASRVHTTHVDDFFISLIDDIKNDKDFDKFIFLSGLVTHYVGDTICHPFVNNRASTIKSLTKKDKDYHYLIEAYMDNYILNIKGENYKKYKCYKLLKPNKNTKIKEMLDKCFDKVFSIKNMGNNYYKCLWNMRFLFFLTRYDPYKIKRIVYSIAYYILPFLYRDIRYLSYNYNLTDKENNLYLNLNHEIWFNNRKKELTYNKSFIDLYDEVIDKSKDMIEKLYDYIYNNKKLDLENFFGNMNYVNGMPIKK